MSKSKSVAKSIRMTEEVYAYISGYRGNGFNEKFENIILDAMIGESSRKRSLALLDNQIADQRKIYYQMVDKYRDVLDFFRELVRLQKFADGIISEADKLKNHPFTSGGVHD